MWEVFITIVNRTKKLATVRVVRTDPQSDEVYRHSYTAIIDTAPQRQAMLQRIKNDYEAYEAEVVADNDMLAGMGDTVANALNTWENE